MPSKKFFALIVALALVGGGGYWWYTHSAHTTEASYKTPEEASNVYVRFEMEAYDSIKQNYWMEPAQYDLPKLFALSAQKVSGSKADVATSTREATAQMLEEVFKSATSTEVSRQWATDLLTVVLYNLIPNGRDQLLSQKQETDLRNEVANVNPGKDLYGDLGLAKGASADEVQKAYDTQAATLAASSSPEAKAQLQKITYDKQVLTNSASKALYDQNQVEPTVFGHIIGHTLYLDVEQISPTTLGEFARAVDAASTTPGLANMIIDFRGNIGGALDFAAAFVGLYVGQNQYAFDLFHQGAYNPARTTTAKFDELNRYKNMVVLTDNMSQSTAELTTASLKRYKLATVVGTQTRGWGSVENTYPLTTVIDPTTSYTLLLVNSLTLRDDEQPIEQNGVTPHVNINDKNWKSELSSLVPSDLASAVEQMVAKGPWKF